MSLIEIKAVFSCDECGTRIEKDMDAAYVRPADWSTIDEAENQLLSGMESIQDGKHLCRDCTAKADKKYFAEHPEEAT